MKLYVKLDKLEHGKEVPGGLGRWCKVHQSIHGRFAPCSAYPREVLDEIKKQERDWLRASASYALLLIFVILLIVTALQ
jgi:hypothetical protein